MQILIKWVRRLANISLLTLFTQVGGVIYLLCLPLMDKAAQKVRPNATWWVRAGLFMGVYILLSVLVLPPLAKTISGREPLPIWGEQVRPLHLGYALLNRHYVKPPLKSIILQAGDALAQQYPGTILAYVDACFPFWDGYPLLPHLSHNDGRKVDLVFLYTDKDGKAVQRQTPTFLGYGSAERPVRGEVDYPTQCHRQGYWQYNLLTNWLPDLPWRSLTLDKARTRFLIRWLARHKQVGKLLLEPHLKTRWQLRSFGKIRWAGCHAVRHDDHVHVQL